MHPGQGLRRKHVYDSIIYMYIYNIHVILYAICMDHVSYNMYHISCFMSHLSCIMSHVYVYDYVSVSVYDYVSVSVYVHVCNVFNLCDVYTFLKAISVMQETRVMYVR